MPEFPTESSKSPYITPEEDQENAGQLRPDVAEGVYRCIRQEAGRRGLEIRPDDNPEEVKRKNQELLQLFDERSDSDLPDYAAAEIVDLEEQATRDPLTGLYNCREFTRLFNAALVEANNSGRPLLFLMIDIDDFKHSNDTLGHAAGDQALQHIARELEKDVEIGDLVCRWGGDEFAAAIIPTGGHGHKEKLLEIAERIRSRAVENLAETRYKPTPEDKGQKSPTPITISVGATLTTPADTLETAYDRADGYLYQAKNSGKDQSFGDNGRITLPS